MRVIKNPDINMFFDIKSEKKNLFKKMFELKIWLVVLFTWITFEVSPDVIFGWVIVIPAILGTVLILETDKGLYDKKEKMKLEVCLRIVDSPQWDLKWKKKWQELVEHGYTIEKANDIVFYDYLQSERDKFINFGDADALDNCKFVQSYLFGEKSVDYFVKCAVGKRKVA